MPEITVPDKLLPFAQTPKRFKLAFGGRGGAKSQTIADLLLMRCTQGMKIACFREMQNSIDDSVYSLLVEEINRLEIGGFTIQKAEIFHESGGVFKFKGLARNPDAIKSMHGFQLFWVEEAQSLSLESIQKLTPTLRTEGSEIWFSLNPMASEDPISQRFLIPYWDELMRDGKFEDDQLLIVKINWRDNPWFPRVLEEERKRDFERMPRSEYDHVWEGEFNDAVENSIILPEWFDAAVDAHVKIGWKPRGLKIVSHDPSDLGSDKKGVCFRHGTVIKDCFEIDKVDVNEGCDLALEYALKKKSDWFVWDGDGLGVSLRRQVTTSLPQMEVSMFKGSMTPDNPNRWYEPIDGDTVNKKTVKDTFRNKRAQYYWDLRDRFYKTYLAVNQMESFDSEELISLSSEIKNLTKLRSEVCRIPLVDNLSGRIQIMSKAQMRTKHKIKSPNMADSLMMSLSPRVNRRKGASPQPMVKVL